MTLQGSQNLLYPLVTYRPLVYHLSVPLPDLLRVSRSGLSGCGPTTSGQGNWANSTETIGVSVAAVASRPAARSDPPPLPAAYAVLSTGVRLNRDRPRLASNEDGGPWGPSGRGPVVPVEQVSSPGSQAVSCGAQADRTCSRNIAGSRAVSTPSSRAVSTPEAPLGTCPGTCPSSSVRPPRRRASFHAHTPGPSIRFDMPIRASLPARASLLHRSGLRSCPTRSTAGWAVPLPAHAWRTGPLT